MNSAEKCRTHTQQKEKKKRRLIPFGFGLSSKFRYFMRKTFFKKKQKKM